jgi:hypothetical protein
MKKPLLYHGTDARMIEMSKEERQRFFDVCELVIDELYRYFIPLLKKEKVSLNIGLQTIYTDEPILKIKYEKILDEKGGPYTYWNLYEKLCMIRWKIKDSGLYQYQSLYLTALKPKAMNYARRSYAGCELGLLAYQLIKGAEIINFEDFHHEEKLIKSIDYIKEFGKEGNEHPVIVTIEKYDKNGLTLENGNKLTADDLKMWHDYPDMDFTFRYNKPLDLSICKIEYLTEDLEKKIRKEYNWSY